MNECQLLRLGSGSGFAFQLAFASKLSRVSSFVASFLSSLQFRGCRLLDQVVAGSVSGERRVYAVGWRRSDDVTCCEATPISASRHCFLLVQPDLNCLLCSIESKWISSVSKKNVKRSWPPCPSPPFSGGRRDHQYSWNYAGDDDPGSERGHACASVEARRCIAPGGILALHQPSDQKGEI